jgi:hypothetical protein
MSTVNRWVDVSTVIAATAGLWALAFAWLTYVMSVRQQGENEFLALKSIANGLRVELELMKGWTGAGGPGYSKKMKPADAPVDWSLPGRVIWKFDYEAIRHLSSSPYLYRLGGIVEPFARLSFSISRLFQLYGEYRSFVNSDPTVWLAEPAPPAAHRNVILTFNFKMHVELIGGIDSDDPMCLFKTYGEAVAALGTFEGSLAKTELPRWFWTGHIASAVCILSGIFLLFRAFRP